MRKLYVLLIAATAAMLMMCSCSDKSNNITSKEICDSFNKKAEQLKIEKEYVPIDTGYYEEPNLETRITLEKLAAAGVITYSVERFAWWTECMTIKYKVVREIEDTYYEGENDVLWSKDIYGTDTVPVYSYEEHFMVDVRITEKYMEMIKDTVSPKGDLDMICPDYSLTDWPQDTLKTAENWTVIPEPQAPAIPHVRKEIKKPEPKPVKQTAVKEREVKNVERVEVVREPKPEPVKYPICKSMDEEMTKKYKEAKEKENKTTVLLFAYATKSVKARNIQILTNDDGTKCAKAQVVLNTVDVTPQGHILTRMINGVPDTTSVQFTYYLDKGWDLDSCPMKKIKVPNYKIGASSDSNDDDVE